MNTYITGLGLFTTATIVLTTLSAYLIYWLLNKSPISGWLNTSDSISPAFLSITAFLFSLAISTIATNSFQRHQMASDNLTSEANSIGVLVSISKLLPAQDGSKLILAVNNYVNAVVDKEWPVISMNGYESRQIAFPEFEALSTVVNNIDIEPNQRGSIEGRMDGAVDSIRHSRLMRQSLAYENNGLKKWPAIPVCSFLLLLCVGLIHLKSQKAMKITLAVAGLCIVTSMVFVYIAMSPYQGWNPVEPYKLRDSLALIDPSLMSK
jgi:hypothetical protein